LPPVRAPRPAVKSRHVCDTVAYAAGEAEAEEEPWEGLNAKLWAADGAAAAAADAVPLIEGALAGTVTIWEPRQARCVVWWRKGGCGAAPQIAQGAIKQ
jgi:hypothetical protein